MRPLALLLLIFSGCSSYKFLVYNPLFGHSHTTFLSRIADTLFEAGHDVTVFLPLIDETLVNKTGVKSGAKLIRMDQVPKTKETMALVREGMFKDMWTITPDLFSLLSRSKNMTKLFKHACDAITSDNTLIETLKSEKFDVGITEPMHLCGYGLFEHIGVRSTIGALSGAQMDPISYFLGEPTAPSYLPSLSSGAGDQMSIIGRLKNVVAMGFGFMFINNIFSSDADIVAKNLKLDYSNHGEVISRSAFMFTNANTYINYPRPLLHKTVEIGGISINMENIGELGEKWEKVLNERPHSVFISFGSVAKSKDMPTEWKESILKLCKSMPKVTFIWKYEEPSTMADDIPNLFLSPWLPQNALLNDLRLSVFITHGGLGSTTEVAHFGKPAIMIPLFADQPRNAAMLARHGGALVLEKTDLGHSETIQKAIQTIIDNKSFAESATHLAGMLREQPISAKQLVISHAEFVAKFGSLPQLDPYGRQLNLLQYYLVDVIAFVLVVLLVVLYVIYAIARFVFRRLCGSKKVKTD